MMFYLMNQIRQVMDNDRENYSMILIVNFFIKS